MPHSPFQSPPQIADKAGLKPGLYIMRLITLDNLKSNLFLAFGRTFGLQRDGSGG